MTHAVESEPSGKLISYHLLSLLRASSVTVSPVFNVPSNLPVGLGVARTFRADLTLPVIGVAVGESVGVGGRAVGADVSVGAVVAVWVAVGATVGGGAVAGAEVGGASVGVPWQPIKTAPAMITRIINLGMT
jgi:hypothetical protein